MATYDSGTISNPENISLVLLASTSPFPRTMQLNSWTGVSMATNLASGKLSPAGFKSYLRTKKLHQLEGARHPCTHVGKLFACARVGTSFRVGSQYFKYLS